MPTARESGYWASRLLLCLATGITVSAAAYLCAWSSYRNNHHRIGYHLNRMDLEALRGGIEAHKETTGEWPARLTDLKVVKEERVRVDETGHPVDWWGRPFQYRLDAGGYVISTYGRDGKPGGFGQDADLYAGQAVPETERPTLWQFAAAPEGLPVQLACALAGVVAFPLCLLQARGQPGNRPSLAKVLLANAVTAVFAILAALMISALHIMPGGH
jgi:hypothetical protein